MGRIAAPRRISTESGTGMFSSTQVTSRNCSRSPAGKLAQWIWTSATDGLALVAARGQTGSLKRGIR